MLVVCSSAQMKPSGAERMLDLGSMIQARGFSAKPV